MNPYASNPRRFPRSLAPFALGAALLLSFGRAAQAEKFFLAAKGKTSATDRSISVTAPRSSSTAINSRSSKRKPRPERPWKNVSTPSKFRRWNSARPGCAMS